jgi:hypothetical protein
MSEEEDRFPTTDTFNGEDIPMPKCFSKITLKETLEPYFIFEDIKDSVFYSSNIEEPAKAIFAVLRKR